MFSWYLIFTIYYSLFTIPHCSRPPGIEPAPSSTAADPQAWYPILCYPVTGNAIMMTFWWEIIAHPGVRWRGSVLFAACVIHVPSS